jgi:hypothetical protein
LKWIRDGANIDAPNAPALAKMEVETQRASGSEKVSIEVQPASGNGDVAVKVQLIIKTEIFSIKA